MRKLISKEVSRLVGAEGSLPLEGGGLGRGWKKYAFTLAEVFSPLCAGSRKIAFTLAEVLITLAIIGVVAAMTMPTLIQNHQKRSLEVATQKFYSMMSQAVRQYMADEGVDDLRNTPLTAILVDDSYNWDDAEEAVENFVKKYLKVVQVCEDSCFADTYRDQLNESRSLNPKGKFVISNGIILDIRAGDNNTTPIELYVDINGKKGPNKFGYDFWSMTIFYDGSIDEGQLTPECKKNNNCTYTSNPTEERQYKFDFCQSGGYGGCFGHFLENNFKFDY